MRLRSQWCSRRTGTSGHEIEGSFRTSLCPSHPHSLPAALNSYTTPPSQCSFPIIHLRQTHIARAATTRTRKIVSYGWSRMRRHFITRGRRTRSVRSGRNKQRNYYGCILAEVSSGYRLSLRQPTAPHNETNKVDGCSVGHLSDSTRVVHMSWRRF